MPINRLNVNSYDELLETLEKVTVELIPTYILFVDIEECEKHKNRLYSQCETIDDIKRLLLDANDGVNVEAVIDEFLELIIPDDRTINYIICYLEPGTWGPGTKICADHDFSIISLPTLIRYRGPQRLEKGEISRFPLLAMLFEQVPLDQIYYGPLPIKFDETEEAEEEEFLLDEEIEELD